LILALVVLSGTLDRLPANGCRLVLEGAGEMVSAPASIVPRRSLHVERAGIAKHSWTPVIVHRVRNKSADLCGAMTLAQPLLSSHLPDSPVLAAGGAAHRSTAARAPPFA
jgi:hypothetical protein